MSYYGVSVLITILVTSLVAFYLLYKAKELNLGIVISISIGSIILGFTFSPAFKAVLKLLIDNININKILALILTLILVLFVFLLFILIISFIISFCIPKKLASIDCCIVIDRFIEKMKSKDGTSIIKDKLTLFLRKLVSQIQEKVKNVFNIINKLKKPVDTKEIIDTMGIEKNENATNQLSDIPTEEVVENIFNDLAEIIVEDKEAESPMTQNEIAELNEIVEAIFDIAEIISENQEIESPMTQNKIAEAELDEILTRDDNNAIEFEADENIADNIEYKEKITETESVIDANSLVLKAFESKGDGRKEEAIEYYITALQHGPSNEMIFWIVLDVCALYKQLGLNDLARIILEGVVSEYGAAIKPEVKTEIMNYLK